MTRTIDIHNHVIPEEALELATSASEFGVQIQPEEASEIQTVIHRAGYKYPLHSSFHKVEDKLEELNRLRADQAVVSIAPPFFFYDLELNRTKAICSRINDGIARMTSESGGRLAGMATLPMQDPEAAMEELYRAVNKLHLSGAEIGPSVGEVPLDDPRYDSLFKLAENLDVPLFIHPYYTGSKQGMEKYYLTNIIGNPLDTTVCLIRLAYAGVFEKCPWLKVIAAHGGGFAPYQIGRADRGHEVREECQNGQASPSEYLRNIYFDTILFSAKALRFLIDWASAKHVLLGSDAPFDMGDENPLRVVEQANLQPEDSSRILCSNAEELFHFPIEINK